jgi:hypothetical protein
LFIPSPFASPSGAGAGSAKYSLMMSGTAWGLSGSGVDPVLAGANASSPEIEMQRQKSEADFLPRMASLHKSGFHAFC